MKGEKGEKGDMIGDMSHRKAYKNRVGPRIKWRCFSVIYYICESKLRSKGQEIRAAHGSWRQFRFGAEERQRQRGGQKLWEDFHGLGLTFQIRV